MDRRRLAAPCGLDCSICGTYEANITEDAKKQVSEFLKIPVEETSCKGCREENGRCIFGPKQQCATWKCVQEKGVLFCYECADFPCGLLAPSAKGASFPHNMKVYNLCRMKLNGIDSWLEESANVRKRYFEGSFIVGQGPVLED